MYVIRNNNDLKTAYIMLRWFNANKQYGKKEVTDELKRDIRAYTRKSIYCVDNGYINYEYRYIKDNGIDGYVELVLMPDGIESLEQAKKIFQENIWMPPYYSFYDCTGTPFSKWYHMFKRNGRYMAYHAVGFDV